MSIGCGVRTAPAYLVIYLTGPVLQVGRRAQLGGGQECFVQSLLQAADQISDMRPNCPPWRDELEITRSSTALDTDTTIDVAIIGGGIAGLATAFFILRETTEQVVLLEAGSVAGGASGYNAGQLVTYFEKPLGSLVDEYGFDLAIAAQREIDDAWSLLDEIQAEAGLAMPMN